MPFLSRYDDSSSAAAEIRIIKIAREPVLSALRLHKDTRTVRCQDVVADLCGELVPAISHSWAMCVLCQPCREGSTRTSAMRSSPPMRAVGWCPWRITKTAQNVSDRLD